MNKYNVKKNARENHNKRNNGDEERKTKNK